LPAPGSPARITRNRTFAAVTGILALSLLAYAFVNVGHFLTEDDSIHKADAIFVLAGSTLDRPLEAVDLYQQGYAPRIVLTRETPERSILISARRGVVLPFKADVARDAMIQLGVPMAAIVVPPRIHDNTAQEAQTLRALAQEQRWRRVIVIAARYQTRRARMAMRRELEETGIDVELRGTRYEVVNPDRWWTSRSDLRWVLDEGAKLLAYELGLGA
jgi:uncharacterized SAM-binding protein YcdF (DUF218 family)